MKTLKIYLDEHNEKSEVGYGLTNLRILSLVDDEYSFDNNRHCCLQ